MRIAWVRGSVGVGRDSDGARAFAADLRGAVVWSQRIAPDPNGACFGIAAWTGGLEIALGD